MFVKQEDMEYTIEGTPVYPLSLHFERNRRLFFARSVADRTAWLQVLREAIGYSNLFAFYNIQAGFGSHG
jgi:hypothetical protein